MPSRGLDLRRSGGEARVGIVSFGDAVVCALGTVRDAKREGPPADPGVLHSDLTVTVAEC